MSTTKAPAKIISSQHASFSIERIYPATPARVFNAWSNPEAKARWFAGPDGWKPLVREMDFRVGGHERVRGQHASGMTSDFHCTYHNIVPGRRVIYAYDMYVDDVLISISLVTVDIEPHEQGTRQLFTEQVVFLDGFDDGGGRERGSNYLVDQIGASLAH
jgi:uncharacterized protein YndB with AHSA1/START domain